MISCITKVVFTILLTRKIGFLKDRECLNGKKLITLYYAMDGVKLRMGNNFGYCKIRGEKIGVKKEILGTLLILTIINKFYLIYLFNLKIKKRNRLEPY
jgi:hypothetical protein